VISRRQAELCSIGQDTKYFYETRKLNYYLLGYNGMLPWYKSTDISEEKLCLHPGYCLFLSWFTLDPKDGGDTVISFHAYLVFFINFEVCKAVIVHILLFLYQF
jgi:hypothetical protein